MLGSTEFPRRGGLQLGADEADSHHMRFAAVLLLLAGLFVSSCTKEVPIESVTALANVWPESERLAGRADAMLMYMNDGIAASTGEAFDAIQVTAAESFLKQAAVVIYYEYSDIYPALNEHHEDAALDAIAQEFWSDGSYGDLLTVRVAPLDPFSDEELGYDMTWSRSMVTGFIACRDGVDHTLHGYESCVSALAFDGIDLYYQD